MARKAKSAEEISNEKTKILDLYTDFARENGKHPTRADLLKLGYRRDVIRYHFGSLKDLKTTAKEREPDAFRHIVDDDFFTNKRIEAAREDIARFKRFVVTTAVTGAPLHKGFLAAVHQYCKLNNALLLVLLASDPASTGDGESIIDPQLVDEHVIFDDMALNDNVFLSAIKLSAKHINPLTGLRRVGQRHGSFIFASPKQHMLAVPTSNNALPHQMMTTGACTVPCYEPSLAKSHRYMSKRTAYIAEIDHVVGGLIVEIQDDQVFHTRQIQADSAGNFIDLGRQYHGGAGAPVVIDAEALVLGDWHSGETDVDAANAFVYDADSVRAAVRPKRVFIHDGFNGLSISHHEVRNAVLRAQRAQENKISLSEELMEYANDLNRLTELFEEVVIVPSNHDEFLARYLQDGRFIDEPQNAKFASLLFHHMCGGANPLRYAVESLIGLKNPEKIRWLDMDEDYKISEIELGAHGHKGANGSKGNLSSMEAAYGRSVSGHAHTPGILRGAWQVGTCSKLKLEYNKGPSSWMHTSCLVYHNGHRQLINVIHGSWRLAPTKKRAAKKKSA